MLLYLVGNVINIKYIMRKRFKTSRLCSSDNYIISKRIHKQDIINSHNNNKAVIATIVERRTNKIPYVRVFGELMQMTLRPVDDHYQMLSNVCINKEEFPQLYPTN